MPRQGARADSTRTIRVGPPEVRIAVRRWLEALALRPLLWSLPLVALGCVLGRAWAEAIRASSPLDSALLAPAMLGPILIALKYLLSSQKRISSRPGSVRWSTIGLAGACLFGIVSAHAARRWTPASDDISRLLQLRQSRLQPLSPVGGRVVARVIEVKRGEGSDFAVLDLVPSARASRALSQARGRVWAELKHSPQVLAVRAGSWILARVELRASRAPGSASEPDERTFALIRGCWCEAEIKSIEAVSPARSGLAAGEVNGLLDAAREGIAARFESGFADLGLPYARQSARLATAMAFGEGGLSEPLPGEMRRAFKRAGVSHVLVASGAQVALVCALLWSLARLLCAPIRHEGWRRALVALMIVPALIFYALLVGGAASIWRAALIGLGALWVQSRGRRMDALSLWCGALSLLLLCDPASLYDLSLQLSFGAAWGLIAFSSVLQNTFLAPLRALQPQREEDEEEQVLELQRLGPQLRRRLSSAAWWRRAMQRIVWLGVRGMGGVASVSVSAHAGTLPVLLYAFGTLSLGSLCANLPIVPLSALLVASGGASLLLPLRPIHALNYHLADGAARIVGAIASWRSWWLEAPALPLAWTLMIGALALCAAAAAWWPRLLFEQRSLEHDAQGLSEHDGPTVPSSSECVLLWRASAQAAREAIEKSIAASAAWLGLSAPMASRRASTSTSEPEARPQ